MVVAGVKYCEYKDVTGTLCPIQSKKIVNDTNYCSAHADLVDPTKAKTISTRPKCVECKKTEPTFALNSAESNKPTHCKSCVEKLGETYQNTTHKYCEECIRLKVDKPIRPTFGEDSKKPTRCLKHKEIGMIDLCNKMCEVCKTTRPSWKNGPNASATRCKSCVPEDKTNWININDKNSTKAEPKVKAEPIKKRNESDYCPRCPADNQKAKMYGEPNGPKQFCFDCKDDGMINVISKRCDFDLGVDENEEKGSTVSEGESPEPHLCGKIAQFGNDKPTRCMEHKEGMKRLVNGCKVLTCNDNRASFGYRNRETNKNTKPTHCSDHIEPGMVDISHVLCKYTENDLFVCDIRASFPKNKDETKEYFCSKHNINNTTDATHRKCSGSDTEQCSARPSYGYLRGNNNTPDPAEKCYKHILDEMVNVVAKRCIKCHYGSQSQSVVNRNKWKNMCFTCWRDTFDDNDALRKRFLRKEQIIVKSLTDHEKLKNVSFVCDKAVGGSNGCRRRPDILIRRQTHNVIIEIDELQHNRVSYNDDDQRIIEILYALKHVPLIVIRFNPDAYECETKKYKGLFAGKGEDIKIYRATQYNESIAELTEAIISAINANPTEQLSIQYLRYTKK